MSLIPLQYRFEYSEFLESLMRAKTPLAKISKKFTPSNPIKFSLPGPEDWSVANPIIIACKVRPS